MKNGSPELCVALAWLAALLTGWAGAQSQNSNSSVITSYGENIQVTQHISTRILNTRHYAKHGK